MKNKGFTLIELLAVIIILGILMLVAIPSVTGYIENSKKTTYVSEINQLVKGVIAKNTSGKIHMNDKDTTYYVPTTCIELENGEAKSPYGKFDPAYVVVTFQNRKYDYYFVGRDEKNVGISEITKLEDISNDSLETKVKTIDTDIGIKGTKDIVIFNSDCTEVLETKPVGTYVGGEEPGNSSEEEIESETTCPDTFTDTIYWALQDTDLDGINDKLVLSDSEVFGNYDGSIPGDYKVDRPHYIPWINVGSNVSSDNLSYNVKEVDIEGVVAPVRTKYWFYGVGYNASIFNADFSNLKTCHTTDMSNMFISTGGSSKKISIKGWEKWDTSNVTTMDSMFLGFATHVDELSFDFLKKWNVTNVRNMGDMFSCTGSNSSIVNIDLSSWKSNSLNDISDMFSSTGRHAKIVNLNLANMDISKVTSFRWLFFYTGNDADTVYINISNWNMSNVTDFGNAFTSVGNRETDRTILIPKTNGNGIENTIYKIYGKDESNYYDFQSYYGTDSYMKFTIAN